MDTFEPNSTLEIPSTIMEVDLLNHTSQYHARYYVERVQYYFLPILIVFGILGNALSAYVILRTKLRKLSSSLYLLALTANDSIMLATIGIQWLRENQIDLYHKPILCQTITYVSDLCGSLSVWLIVAFTAERFVVVKYPLRSKSVCTITRAKFIILILVATMAVIYSPLLFIVGLDYHAEFNKTICLPKEEWREFGVVFNLFDFICTGLLPVQIIAILNSIICRKIWSFKNIRRRMTETYRMETMNEEDSQTLNQVKLRATRSSYKMTKMLLIVSTVCLIMILPSFIMRLILHLGSLNLFEIHDQYSFVTLQLFFQFIYYLTFGINFALYCISGQNFRRAVAITLFCSKTTRREGGTTTENRTQSSGLLSSQATFKQRKSIRMQELSI